MLERVEWFRRKIKNQFIRLYRRTRTIKGVFQKWRNRQHRRAALATFIVRKIVRKPIVLSDRNGFQYIVLPEEYIYSLFYDGYLGYPEIGEQEFCKKILQPGMTVFDIGAHIGQFTLLFASLVGPSGRVFAFEPCESTVRRLRAHVALNGFSNVVAEQAAVHAIHGGYVSLNIFSQGYSAWNTIGKPTMLSRDNPRRRVEPAGQEIVPTVTIDEYCGERGIQHVDYLKVDVEGAELDALKGCSELLQKGAIGYVQFEVSRAMIQGMGRDSSEMFKFLGDFGYKCHPISDSGDLLPPVTTTGAFFANFIAVPECKQQGGGDED